MVLTINIHDSDAEPTRLRSNASSAKSSSSSVSSAVSRMESLAGAEAAEQLEALLNSMEDLPDRPPGWLADEVDAETAAGDQPTAGTDETFSTQGRTNPDALKLRSGGCRNPDAAQRRPPPVIGPSCRATVPTRPGHSIRPDFSMIPENPTEECREEADTVRTERTERTAGARTYAAERDGGGDDESSSGSDEDSDEESAKPPVPTSFSARPNSMMNYVPQYDLFKRKKGKGGKRKDDGGEGGGKKVDVDDALEQYCEMERLLPGETPPIITMMSSGSHKVSYIR